MNVSFHSFVSRRGVSFRFVFRRGVSFHSFVSNECERTPSCTQCQKELDMLMYITCRIRPDTLLADVSCCNASGSVFPHGDVLVREGYALRTAAHRWWTVNNNRVSFCGRRSNLPWAGSVKCVYRFHTYRGGTCSRAGHRSSWSWLARSQCHT